MKIILSAALAAGVSTAALAQGLDAGNVIALDTWNYDELYADGWSAEEFIDEMEVVDATGEDVGDVEDIIVGASGQVLSVVAEVGGFLDIGDTHVSIPWDQVTVQGENVVIPIAEENIDQYDYFNYSGLAGGQLTEQMVTGVDDVPTGARAWRVSELIGDYARIRDGETWTDHGYVNDLIIRDGEVVAAVVERGAAFGRGYYAYPFYGYGYGAGWEPGAPYYDMPYTRDEVGTLEPFEYNRFAM